MTVLGLESGEPWWYLRAALVIGCFGVGNMFQSNQAYQQMLVITGGETSFLADYSLLFDWF